MFAASYSCLWGSANRQLYMRRFVLFPIDRGTQDAPLPQGFAGQGAGYGGSRCRHTMSSLEADLLGRAAPPAPRPARPGLSPCCRPAPHRCRSTATRGPGRRRQRRDLGWVSWRSGRSSSATVSHSMTASAAASSWSRSSKSPTTPENCAAASAPNFLATRRSKTVLDPSRCPFRWPIRWPSSRSLAISSSICVYICLASVKLVISDSSSSVPPHLRAAPAAHSANACAIPACPGLGYASNTSSSTARTFAVPLSRTPQMPLDGDPRSGFRRRQRRDLGRVSWRSGRSAPRPCRTR